MRPFGRGPSRDGRASRLSSLSRTNLLREELRGAKLQETLHLRDGQGKNLEDRRLCVSGRSIFLHKVVTLVCVHRVMIQLLYFRPLIPKRIARICVTTLPSGATPLTSTIPETMFAGTKNYKKKIGDQKSIQVLANKMRDLRVSAFRKRVSAF